MLPRSRTTALALAVVLAGLGAPALADESPTGRAPLAATEPGVPAGGVDGPHSSDGVRGEVAPRAVARDDEPGTRVVLEQRRIAPGVKFSSWSETDSRGPVRSHLLAVDLDESSLQLDYAAPTTVAATDDVMSLARAREAIAAVNGDFFDIGRTGAPLGVGRSVTRGLFNARASGWNSAFYLTRKGRPQVGEVTLRGAIKERPAATVTNFNSHFVAPGGIGVYTQRWGSSPGYAVTQGQEKDVRMVEVRDGRVVANRARLRPGSKIRGLVLVGRGEGAKQLRKLRRGSATVRWWLGGRPSMVVTGSKALIDEGVVQVVDDTEMHPRTAVGIDRDTNEVLLLVVDGRSSTSRGQTLVELARTMVELGADEALNLDGGGSSTMVAREQGALQVQNSPSDGSLRQVANGLVVTQR
ncbi:exopolysaccharide biosynthesis protein [Nocardioides marinisabuli]|uniref:Exopolysaccharide biosynthesis protein n=1 Tax=Nocardioides marinisabuli TaxID=419476 RepID=A0A7Y9EYF2_9ACTN|nr:phosphodiester glycosidase family protein [Nocardioides marinisabuli]NYD56252.1 exopolysaccharide biosynthesis protein [Nocardioides marinisabuli]